MAIKAGFGWECKCGYTYFGQRPPKECPKCGGWEFIRLPDEIAEERDEEECIKELKSFKKPRKKSK